MKSLKLKLDDLQIESFTTSAPSTERGTVNGHSGDYGCNSDICTTEPSNPNRASCPGFTCVGITCTNSGDPYNTFGCQGGGGSLAYTQCEPETCDPMICGPY